MCELFCTGLLRFPSYLSVQISCVSPATFLYRFTVFPQLPFYTDLVRFPIYPCVQIYLAFPPTCLYTFIVLLQLPFYVLSFLIVCSLPIPISTSILTLFNKGKPL